jgi:hypothetical protein
MDTTLSADDPASEPGKNFLPEDEIILAFTFGAW